MVVSAGNAPVPNLLVYYNGSCFTDKKRGHRPFSFFMQETITYFINTPVSQQDSLTRIEIDVRIAFRLTKIV